MIRLKIKESLRGIFRMYYYITFTLIMRTKYLSMEYSLHSTCSHGTIKESLIG